MEKHDAVWVRIFEKTLDAFFSSDLEYSENYSSWLENFSTGGDPTTPTGMGKDLVRFLQLKDKYGNLRDGTRVREWLRKYREKGDPPVPRNEEDKIRIANALNFPDFSTLRSETAKEIYAEKSESSSQIPPGLLLFLQNTVKVTKTVNTPFTEIRIPVEKVFSHSVSEVSQSDSNSIDGTQILGDRRDLFDIVREHQFVFLQGGGGVGKSTILKSLVHRVSVEALQEYQPGKSLIPVRIQLRVLSEFKLLEVLRRRISLIAGKDQAISIGGLLHQNNFIIVLDGLDDLDNDQVYSFFHGLEELFNLSPQSRIVISGRERPQNELLNGLGFQSVEVSKLDNLTIGEFIQSYLPEKATNLLLKNLIKTGFLQAGYNPLLLSFAIADHIQFNEELAEGNYNSQFEIFDRLITKQIFLNYKKAFKEELSKKK